MKSDSPQSVGLLRCRVEVFSSIASANKRFCCVVFGAGTATLLLGLPPGYTASKKRFCSPDMKPPQAMFRHGNRRANERQKFSQNLRAIRCHLLGHNGVPEIRTTTAGKRGTVPFNVEARERIRFSEPFSPVSS